MGDPVDVRGDGEGVAAAAELVPAQIIDQNDDKVGLFCRCRPRGCGAGADQDGENDVEPMEENACAHETYSL